MIAAIYARKSTDQSLVAEDQTSVSRQVARAREYAEGKGWIVADDCVYIDDGISGAEFANRPGFVRLMSALKPKPPFGALVMSEESRLGREQIEVGYALKQLVTRGVRVFCYLTDTERRLDSPIEKAMLALQTMADELEREKARQRTADAMLRKASAGHVTGGRVFGYDNVEIHAPGGGRSHVRREINAEQAAIVRQIFELATLGAGATRIAKQLNEEGAISPRAQRGRPNGWASSSVREVLRRELYRGVIIYNQSKKRDQWGQRRQQPRPEEEWLRLPAEELRIVSDELWNAAHVAIAVNAARATGGSNPCRPGRTPGSGGKYLLTGLMTCGQCGGGIEARSRSHGGRRVFFYGCSTFQRKGEHVCGNKLTVPMEDANTAVLSVLEDVLLSPDIINAAIEAAIARIRAPKSDDCERLHAEVDRLDLQLQRLSDAIAEGGEIGALIPAIREREAARNETLARLRAIESSSRSATRTDAELERKARSVVANWRAAFHKHPAKARQAIQALIDGRLTLRPRCEDDREFYQFEGTGTLEPVLAGVLLPHNLASPTGFAPCWIVHVCDEWSRVA